jgi:hypothetical protein
MIISVQEGQLSYNNDKPFRDSRFPISEGGLKAARALLSLGKDFIFFMN